MRRPIRWIGAAALLLLAGVALDAARASRRPPSLRTAIPPLPTPPPTPTVRSALVLQLRDCTGNLRLLSWLRTPPLAAGMQLAVLWYEGPVADSSRIRPLLPPWTSAIPLRPVPRVVVRELARLGHVATPVLMVLDAESRVRLTTQAPRSAREAAGLRRALDGLTWFEDR